MPPADQNFSLSVLKINICSHPAAAAACCCRCWGWGNQGQMPVLADKSNIASLLKAEKSTLTTMQASDVDCAMFFPVCRLSLDAEQGQQF